MECYVGFKPTNSLLISPEPKWLPYAPHLLHILLGANIRGMHEGAHDLEVAVDDHCFIGTVRVYAHPAVVIHRVRQLAPLPQHLAVTLKLSRV